jgi:hypothetical protein
VKVNVGVTIGVVDTDGIVTPALGAIAGAFESGSSSVTVTGVDAVLKTPALGAIDGGGFTGSRGFTVLSVVGVLGKLTPATMGMDGVEGGSSGVMAPPSAPGVTETLPPPPGG